MNELLNIWGREFNIEVVFDIYEGEQISQKQEEALSEFISKSHELLIDPSCLKEYLTKTSNGQVPDPIDNIFKYVLPRTLLVGRSNDKRVVVLLCDYRFDTEHGIAILFENEMFAKVSSQANF